MLPEIQNTRVFSQTRDISQKRNEMIEMIFFAVTTAGFVATIRVSITFSSTSSKTFTLLSYFFRETSKVVGKVQILKIEQIQKLSNT